MVLHLGWLGGRCVKAQGPSALVLLGLMVVAAGAAEPGAVAATGLVPTDLTQFVVRPEVSTVLHFTGASGAPAEPAGQVEITDYQQRPWGQTRLLRNADGSFSVPVQLPRGYFELRMATGERFGVLALSSPTATDPFFGVDAALSWLERRTARRQQLVALMARCGIATARERLHLGHLHDRLDQWTWDRNSKYDELRQVYQQAGLPLLDMLQGAPAYNSGASLGAPGLPWPQQQPWAAQMYAKVLAHFQPVWGGVEIQNEPDFYQRPAGYYTVQVKTASWAFAQQATEVPLVAGVTAFTPPSDWYEGCGQNGLLDDCDAFSFHTYRPAAETATIVARLRDWLARYGHPRLPLWHSECGWPWPAGTPRADYESDRASAMEIAAKAVESKACGLARYFPYVLVYQVLGGHNDGLLGQEGSPLRSWAAYVQAVSVLSGAAYLGDLRALPPGVRLARVFGWQGRDDALVVLYSGSSAKPATVVLPTEVLQASGIDGRALQVKDRQVVLDDGLCYLSVRRDAIATALQTDTDVARLWDLGRSAEKVRRRASPLVLQLVEDCFPAVPSATKYRVSRETANQLAVRVRLNNLSDVALPARVTATLPNGGPTFPLPPVTVEARSVCDLEWPAMEASPWLDITAVRCLRVSAEPLSPGVPRPTDLAVPLQIQGSLEDYLARCGTPTVLPILRLERWTPNLDGRGHCEFETGRGAFTMRVRFDGKGSWAYPRFALDPSERMPTASAVLLRARIARSARWVRLTAKTAGPDFWKTDLFPADGQWHAVLVPFAEFVAQGAGQANEQLTAAALRSFDLGMVSNEPDNVLELSHLMLVSP